jgi:K319-like protein
MVFQWKQRPCRKTSHRHRLNFEHLELRQLMSITPPLSAPLLEVTGDSLQQQATPDLTSNWAPMVYAGEDLSTKQGTDIMLNGEVLANLAINMTVTWSLVAGPGTVSFADPGATSTTAGFSQEGTYELALTADNNGATASDRVVVNVTATNVINIDQVWLDQQGFGPYYLDQEDSTYVLQTDVTTDGTAFAIIAKNIIFDLNGHTITYDNATPITISNHSFENGTGGAADNWDFTNAANAARFAGDFFNNEIYDGDYSIKFSDTTADEYIESTETITLEANTTYSLSGMFEYGENEDPNPGVKGYIKLVGEGLPTIEVSKNDTNGRGIQLNEAEFTTGDSNAVYTVQVGIEGDASGTKPYFIDDVKVQRTKTYGVVLSPRSWNTAETPGVIQYGTASNSTVMNGTIVQGSEGATWGHGIFNFSTYGITASDLNITVNGANSSTLCGMDTYTKPMVIIGNTLTSNVQTITSRSRFDGVVVSSIVGIIQNNTITNGPHGGFISGGSGSSSTISGNTIQLKAKYTNAFAIIGSGGSHIYDNVINNGSGDYASRGIAVQSGTVDVVSKIYNNTIRVQQLANNQEYGGAHGWGTYGIQLEDASHVEVYGNTVYANAEENKAFAFRMNSNGGAPENVYVHDNIFIATAVNGIAATLKIASITGGLRFEDNTLITNDGIVGDTEESTVDLVRSHIEASSPLTSPHVFTTEYVTGTELHAEISFIDNTFEDANSRSHFVEGDVTNQSGNLDDRMNIFAKWTTTVDVKDGNNAPLAGASVIVTDKDGVQVFSGNTDAAGQVSVLLKEYCTQGSTRTQYNPYTVTASAQGEETTLDFVADKTQTINLQLSGSIQSLMMPAASQSYAVIFAPTESIAFTNVSKANDYNTSNEIIEEVDATPTLVNNKLNVDIYPTESSSNEKDAIEYLEDEDKHGPLKEAFEILATTPILPELF